MKWLLVEVFPCNLVLELLEFAIFAQNEV